MNKKDAGTKDMLLYKNFILSRHRRLGLNKKSVFFAYSPEIRSPDTLDFSISYAIVSVLRKIPRSKNTPIAT